MKCVKYQGFTLIELMIVVAIIGILASIAIPAYSKYQSKAKVISALAEISGGKTSFELKRDNAENITLASDVGLQATTSNCNITVSNTELACEIVNAPSQVNSKFIKWERTAIEGVWNCLAPTIAAEYKPKACS